MGIVLIITSVFHPVTQKPEITTKHVSISPTIAARITSTPTLTKSSYIQSVPTAIPTTSPNPSPASTPVPTAIPAKTTIQTNPTSIPPTNFSPTFPPTGSTGYGPHGSFSGNDGTASWPVHFPSPGKLSYSGTCAFKVTKDGTEIFQHDNSDGSGDVTISDAGNYTVSRTGFGYCTITQYY